MSKSLCAANCGERTQDYSHKYCMSCLNKYLIVQPCFLRFCPAKEKPKQEGDYLLLNLCDGYHIAEAVFEGKDFIGFYQFASAEVENNYSAWALLPDVNEEMRPVFED